MYDAVLVVTFFFLTLSIEAGLFCTFYIDEMMAFAA